MHDGHGIGGGRAAGRGDARPLARLADPVADRALRAQLEAPFERLRQESDRLHAAPAAATLDTVERLLAAIDAEHATLAAATPEILTGEEPASEERFRFGREVVRVQRKLAVLRSRVLALARGRASRS